MIEGIAAVEASKQIAETINSTLDAPSKEIGNYIADKIRYLRYKSLLKIIKKAEIRAKAEGMELKMPPLKFFVSFCESAALEADDDELTERNTDLREMWENLLISSGSAPTGESLYHLNILKNIGLEEANFLSALIYDGRADTYFTPLVSWDATDAKYLKANSFVAAFNQLPDNFDPENLSEIIVRCAECSGILFEEISFLTDNPDEISSDFSHERKKLRSAPASVLRSLGVIEEFDFDDISVGRWDPSLQFSADGYRITNMGIRFFEACVGKLPRQSVFYEIVENSEGRTLDEIIRPRSVRNQS